MTKAKETAAGKRKLMPHQDAGKTKTARHPHAAMIGDMKDHGLKPESKGGSLLKGRAHVNHVKSSLIAHGFRATKPQKDNLYTQHKYVHPETNHVATFKTFKKQPDVLSLRVAPPA